MVRYEGGYQSGEPGGDYITSSSIDFGVGDCGTVLYKLTR